MLASSSCRALLAVVGLLATTAAATEFPGWVWPPGDQVTSYIAETLARHPEGEEIRRWVDRAPVAERLSAEFLLAWMPASDLGALGAEELRENVSAALAAWREAPWSAETPTALFFHYVLPYRVSQEPVEDWRSRLRSRLAERVAGLGLEAALLEVNRWCHEQVDFVSTSRRDQGPLATLERGYGRCEERMILSIAAMRAVGIPARACSTPWWTTTDNNHAWLEAWSGPARGWAYLEACDESRCLNHAWFSRPLKRAGLVLSTGWGEAASAACGGDELLRSSEGATLINSTAAYTNPGLLRIPEGEDSLEVAINAFNYGGFFALTTIGKGKSIQLGPGDYLLSTTIEGQPAVSVAQVRPGQEWSAAFSSNRILEGQATWLRYPVQEGELAACPEPAPDDAQLLSHRLRRMTNLRGRDRSTATGRDWVAALGGREDAGALEDALRRAGATRGPWEEAFLALEGKPREAAAALYQEMDAKDFLELEPEALPALLERMLTLRGTHCPDLADSLWRSWIISPRLYHQAGTQAWWTDLPLLPPGIGADQLLEHFRTRVQLAAESRLGHVASPEQTWRSGWADSASARACLTALFRIHGLPARAQRGRKSVEIWTGEQWRELQPFAEGEGEKEAELEADDPSPAHLRVLYTAGGDTLKSVATWRQTLLSQFEEGAFRPVYVGQLWERNGEVAWDLQPGEYWLSAGLRNSLGEPRFQMHEIELAAGDTLCLALEIGIPLAELDEGSLVRHQLDLGQACPLRRRGQPRAWERVLPSGPVLLLLLDPDQEPSQRHRRALAAASAELPPILEVFVAGQGELSIEQDALLGSFHVKDPSTELPLTILLDEDRQTRVWMNGMQQSMADLVRLRLGTAP